MICYFFIAPFKVECHVTIHSHGPWGGGLKGNTRGEESFSRFALAIGDFPGG